MRKLISIVLLLALLQGCEEHTKSPVQLKSIAFIDANGKTSSIVYIYRLGNCQYLSGNSGVGSNGGVLCHYGECDNPIHKCKCQ